MLTRLSPSDSIQINWLTLSFAEDLEKAFEDHYFHTSLRQVRIASALGVFFYAIFGVLDAWLVPEVKLNLWFIRYVVVCPVVFMTFLLSFSRHFKKYMQLSIASTVLLAGLGIIAMIIIAPYPASHSYYAGLSLVFFYGYAFFKLRFVWASLTGWIIVIAYEIAAIWLSPTPIPILINNNFFFLTGNIFGMFACYSIEYYLRKEFLQARLLQAEKKKVVDINLDLEKRVAERTAQMLKTNEELKQEISERRRAENALRESEEKYRLLVENADTAIFIAQDEVIKFPNPKTLELIGYTEDELIKVPFVNLIHPEDRATVLERHRSRLKGEKPPNSYTFRIVNKNGEKLWTQLNTVLITWEGRPATLNFLRDITSQKKLEAELQQAQKMEAIGTLAGGVAHDLNNILSGIVSYPELILLDLPENSPLRNPLLTIQESGQKAAAIVQDLLTLARRGVSVAEVVNLNQVIKQYLASPEYQKLLSFHSGITVERNLEPNLFSISGSPVHLSKTIMNLVSNAAEAMPDGGRIIISTDNHYVDTPINAYETIEEGDYVTVTVSDTGTGIPSVEIDKIFEPFYTKKIMGRSGPGLGMAVVWGTVKDHNGFIDVQSTLGKGTTFTLYFPITRDKLDTKKSSLKIEDYKGNGESIFIIDDIQEQREIASGMLKKMGYHVSLAASGEEAVTYMKQKHADLLVLDMIMNPGMDGLETYKRILEIHPGQKAVIASGYSETNRVKQAQKMGARTYIKKPYSLEKIGVAIKNALQE
ncbi:MAG: PAS domain S-box protein [Desulfobacterales bacterium]|nr:MAG: PAS domain S-box protein [Desulfobacterales bacterium]